MQNLLRAWFVKRHGIGADNQAELHRCYTCGRLVTWNHIRSGEPCCAGRMFPTNPTVLEKMRLLIMPWSI